jgi:outer membrane protein assembly factor BamE (lipoprotein component of BamABCDE complex)
MQSISFEKKIVIAKAILLICILFIGCATPSKTSQQIEKESALTPGMAKIYIHPGKTNQTEVLEIFGPPDLVTHKYGKDVWTYDKISYEISTQGGYLTVLLAGISGRRSSTSNKSVMLIIYFDENDVVMDYKLSAAKF